MKPIQVILVFLSFALALHDLRLVAQPTEPDRKAFEELKAKAEKGDAESQFKLASAYAVGKNIPADQGEATKWFRKAADQGHVKAQLNVGWSYATGSGVQKDDAEAVKWWTKAAEKGDSAAQFFLADALSKGKGVKEDRAEAAKLFRKSAELGNPSAQHRLGLCYAVGDCVPKDTAQAFGWFRKAAEQGFTLGLLNLAKDLAEGETGPANHVAGYIWFSIAATLGDETAGKEREKLSIRMTPEQVSEAQRLTREFIAGNSSQRSPSGNHKTASQDEPSGSGTGFFISADGFLVTNEHVVRDAAQIRLVTSAGLISARVVKVDAANDLALLKAEGRFAALPVAASRAVKLGGTVATVGFPNIGLQGFAPKLAKGEIASLSGAGDDARYFQISVPVQPGNSGGALVDERGNVVGVVSAKLSARAALAASGALPENVNYAVKSSYLLGFLESVPEVSAKLKEPRTVERKFEEVVKDAEQAAVLVLVY